MKSESTRKDESLQHSFLFTFFMVTLFISIAPVRHSSGLTQVAALYATGTLFAGLVLMFFQADKKKPVTAH